MNEALRVSHTLHLRWLWPRVHADVKTKSCNDQIVVLGNNKDRFAARVWEKIARLRC
jgi:hypothetical protein